MIALPRVGLSDGELAVYSADLAQALPVAPIVINGEPAPLISPPEFVYSDGTETRTCKSVNCCILSLPWVCSIKHDRNVLANCLNSVTWLN